MGLPSGHAAVIELDPLSGDEVEALLADVCGRAAELSEVAVTFHDRTGGNPLQVRQLLGRAQREGAARAETDVTPRGMHRSGKPKAAAALLRMKLTVRRWSDERLLQLPRPPHDRGAADPQRATQHRLHRASDLFPAVVSKKLQLTVTRGPVPSSPVALASFGVLPVVTGEYVGSQRFAELGMLLANGVKFRPESASKR